MYATYDAVIRDLAKFPGAEVHLWPVSICADEGGYAVVVDHQARAFVDDDVAEQLVIQLKLRIRTPDL
jgi:hypothetical protein